MNTEHDCIYVASLTDYNGGILHGVWIDLNMCESECDLNDAVAQMLASSPGAAKGWGIAEEYAIHDYVGFSGINIDENTQLSTVWELHIVLLELTDFERGAFGEYVDYNGIKYVDSETVEAFRDSYRGEYDSEQAFAQELAEEIGIFDGANDILVSYFDYEAFARDIFIGDYYMTETGHVFASY